MNLRSKRLWTGPTLAAALLGVFFVALPGVVRAAEQVPSFGLEQLVPEADTGGSLVSGTALVPKLGTYRVALAAMYELDPLTLYNGSKLLDIPVRNRVTGFLTGAFVVLPRFELSISLPYVLQQNGDNPTQYGYLPVGGNGFGTPFIGGRVALAQQASGWPIDLALELNAGLSLTNGVALGQDRGWLLLPGILASRTFGPVLVSLDVRALLQPTAVVVNEKLGDGLKLGAAITTLGSVVRGELTATTDVSFSGQPASLELFLGGRVFLPYGFEIFAGAGPGLGSAPGIPAFRALLGVAIHGAPPDAAPPPPAACPPPPAPVPQKLVDSDGDGIPDIYDTCPGEAGPKGRGGCPVHDRDHDGIEDDKDKCPDEPGPLALQGCPDKDSDGDGIPDSIDNCPNEGGPKGNAGCPERVVEITREHLEIHQKILFKTGKAEILPPSFPLLNEVAKVLDAHLEIKSVLVEGHTDNKGTTSSNMKLSQARADSVRSFLIKAGVAADRISAKGFGPTRPIAGNDTEAGREANRRVEFSIVMADKVERTEKVVPAPKPAADAKPTPLAAPAKSKDETPAAPPASVKPVDGAPAKSVTPAPATDSKMTDLPPIPTNDDSKNLDLPLPPAGDEGK